MNRGFQELGLLISAWASGENFRINSGDEWRDVTPDNIKAKAGDEWVSLREAIRRFDERNRSYE